MIRGLYTAASGMIVRQAQQENISNNLANVNTPGFKKDDIALKSFEELLIKSTETTPNGKVINRNVGSMEFGVGIDANKTYFSQGVLEDTGRNLDFALNGPGFFTSVDGNGNEVYTRDGRLSVDRDGYVVSTSGNKILGVDENGNKKPINVSNADFKLGSDGTIDTTNGKMKFCISDFNDYNSLLKDSSNNYRTTAQPIALNTEVKQNTLEKSNVDAIQTITDMISVMRNYESSQKVIQQMDETLGKTVNEVGSVK